MNVFVYVCIYKYMYAYRICVYNAWTYTHACTYMYIKHTKNNACTCTILQSPHLHPSHLPPFLSLYQQKPPF